MELWRRVAFFVCGVLLMLPVGMQNIYWDMAFRILGGSYILVAIFWPGKKKDELDR
jgi:hypothetical protein